MKKKLDKRHRLRELKGSTTKQERDHTTEKNKIPDKSQFCIKQFFRSVVLKHLFKIKKKLQNYHLINKWVKIG